MPDTDQPSGARQAFGDFAPTFVDYTDDVLFGRVWPDPVLAARDRSLVTVAALMTLGASEQLVHHVGLAKNNGVTEEELKAAITHLAFYTGWPRAMSAMTVAKQVFTNAS